MQEICFHYVTLVASPAVMERYHQSLSDEERSRAARFASRQLMERFIVAHGALRVVLGRLLGINPAIVEFSKRGNDKPCLSSTRHGDRWKFNMAHSHDRALIGVSGIEIGVDLEKLRPLADVEALAPIVLTDSERHLLDRLTGDARTGAFYRYWIAKEACMKQTGDGLLLDPKRIQVSWAETAHSAVCGDVTWNIGEFSLEPGYGMAFAVCEPDVRYRVDLFDNDRI